MNYKVLAFIVILCMLLSACGHSAGTAPAQTAAPTALLEADLAGFVESVTYKGLHADMPDDAVTDAEFEQGLQRFLSEYATTEKITDRPVEPGDTVSLDYIAMKDGSFIADFWRDGAKLIVGSGTTFAEFEDALVGKECGKEFSVDAALPQSVSAQYGGQTVHIMVVIHYIETAPAVPELTDPFVSSLDGWNCATVDEFKTALRELLAAQKKSYCRMLYLDDLWRQVMASADFNRAGEDYIADFSEKAVDECEKSAADAGAALDLYAQRNGYADADALLGAVRQKAGEEARTLLVIKRIAQAESIAYSDDAYYDAVDEYAKQAGFATTADMIGAYGVGYVEEVVGNGLLYDMARDFVAANAL